MKLRNAEIKDFEGSVKYICMLCGFPAVPFEKMDVLIRFLRDQHGNNTIEDLQDAFTALASGRLDEKLESIKSLTGLSASRVITSWYRLKKSKDSNVPLPEGNRSFVTDENKKLIQDNFSRVVFYNDELTEEERKFLMQHWVNVSKDNFKRICRPDLLTATAYDFLEANGSLRNKGGMLQAWTGKAYEDIMAWTTIEDGGKRLKANEDMAISKSRQGNLRQMLSPSAGGSLDNAVKRFAVAQYFEFIN